MGERSKLVVDISDDIDSEAHRNSYFQAPRFSAIFLSDRRTQMLCLRCLFF
jgi:hypothetical protein